MAVSNFKGCYRNENLNYCNTNYSNEVTGGICTMKNVTMFTNNSWPYCTAAKKFLSQNNIPFEEKNISTDEHALLELQRRNINSVPTFVVGDETIVGFNKDKILALLHW